MLVMLFNAFLVTQV